MTASQEEDTEMTCEPFVSLHDILPGATIRYRGDPKGFFVLWRGDHEIVVARECQEYDLEFKILASWVLFDRDFTLDISGAYILASAASIDQAQRLFQLSELFEVEPVVDYSFWERALRLCEATPRH